MTIKPEEVLRIEDLTVSQNQNEDEDDARQNALRKELEGVKNLNHVMESVITAMTKAKDNMDVHSHINKSDYRPSETQSKTQIDY